MLGFLIIIITLSIIAELFCGMFIREKSIYNEFDGQLISVIVAAILVFSFSVTGLILYDQKCCKKQFSSKDYSINRKIVIEQNQIDTIYYFNGK